MASKPDVELHQAAKEISNPFWQAVLVKLPLIETTFYTNKNKKLCMCWRESSVGQF